MEVNGELDIADRVVRETKYIELVELVRSIEPGKGRRVFPEKEDCIAVMRMLCNAMSALSDCGVYKKYRMKDRVTATSFGKEDGRPYLDVYILKGESS